MKIFITGAKGIGKSSCIQRIIKKCQMEPCGFVTLPFYEKGIRKGFYMHSFLELKDNDVMFSVQYENHNEVIQNVFNKFGVFVLQESLQHQNCVMIIDEIGHLESMETKYLDTLIMAIDIHPNVIGVLKKCDQEYITTIKNRSDVLVLDMDILDSEEVEKIIIEKWENKYA